MEIWSWRAAAGGIMLATVTVLGGAEAGAQGAAPVRAAAQAAPSPGAIVAAAPKADWVEIGADDLLVMELGESQASAARGKDEASILRQA